MHFDWLTLVPRAHRYFYNTESGEVKWTNPDEPAVVEKELAVPIPKKSAWITATTPEGHIYYHQEDTGETSWTMPSEDAAAAVPTTTAAPRVTATVHQSVVDHGPRKLMLLLPPPPLRSPLITTASSKRDYAGWWYWTIKGERKGPFKWREILHALQSEAIPVSTRICPEHDKSLQQTRLLTNRRTYQSKLRSKTKASNSVTSHTCN